MRPKTLVLLCLALGCGLVASIGISQVMDRNKSAGGEMQNILVATADIKALEVLTPANLKVEQWPRDKVPQNALGRLEDIEKARAKTAIFAGAPLIAGQVLKAGEYYDPTADLPKGYRSVAMQVDDVSSGGQLLRPGSRVDVLVFVNKASNPEVKQTGTYTILQDIQVFAIDQTVRKIGEKIDEAVKAKTVSLVVTAEQAQTVMTAGEIGKLRLMMRRQDEGEVEQIKLTKLQDLFVSQKKERSPDIDPDATPQPAPAPASSGPGVGSAVMSFLENMKAAGANMQASSNPNRVESFTMEVINGAEEKKVEFSRPAVKGAGWQQAAPSTVPPIEQLPVTPAVGPGSGSSADASPLPGLLKAAMGK